MNPGLLTSQFDTLEMPSDAIRVSIDRAPEEIAADILQKLEISPARVT
jgi:gluconokinase